MTEDDKKIRKQFEESAAVLFPYMRPENVKEGVELALKMESILRGRQGYPVAISIYLMAFFLFALNKAGNEAWIDNFNSFCDSMRFALETTDVHLVQ